MNNYTVSGDLSTLFKGTSYVVKYDSVYILNDSTRILRKGQKQQKYAVKDGKFKISGYVGQPLYSTLQIEARMEHTMGKQSNTVCQDLSSLRPATS